MSKIRVVGGFFLMSFIATCLPADEKDVLIKRAHDLVNAVDGMCRRQQIENIESQMLQAETSDQLARLKEDEKRAKELADQGSEKRRGALLKSQEDLAQKLAALQAAQSSGGRVVMQDAASIVSNDQVLDSHRVAATKERIEQLKSQHERAQQRHALMEERLRRAQESLAQWRQDADPKGESSVMVKSNKKKKHVSFSPKKQVRVYSLEGFTDKREDVSADFDVSFNSQVPSGMSSSDSGVLDNSLPVDHHVDHSVEIRAHVSPSSSSQQEVVIAGSSAVAAAAFMLYYFLKRRIVAQKRVESPENYDMYRAEYASLSKMLALSGLGAGIGTVLAFYFSYGRNKPL